MYIKVVGVKGIPVYELSRTRHVTVATRMLSIERNYSRLFRPWDECEKDDRREKDIVSDTKNQNEQAKTKAKKQLDKRESRLRKIRGTFKKFDVHQDATVSTTTVDSCDLEKARSKSDTEKDNLSSVTKLSMCCDRLLSPKREEPTTLKNDNATITPLLPNPYEHPEVLPQTYRNPTPGYITADIAHALGVPATDPLLLESLAQGYAMELEYARIMQQENEVKLINARKQRPKKYKCPHCHVGFSNNGQLKGHVRIHTGERPYKCDERNCGKTFTRNEELTRHKRIHSGVRPYPCQTCGKRFGRRDHLKKHSRTHYLQAERMMPVFVPLSAIPHVGGFPYLYGY